jgi:hypothetical protein
VQVRNDDIPLDSIRAPGIAVNDFHERHAFRDMEPTAPAGQSNDPSIITPIFVEHCRIERTTNPIAPRWLEWFRRRDNG